MATKRTKRTTKAPVEATDAEQTCFTIMPFGGWFDTYYTEIYIPAILDAGLTPHRADDLYRPSAIVHDIWDYTKQSRIVLADLTGKNANVFYELGLAHALAKPVVLVAQSMDDIPFDLRALRVILYDKNAPDWGENLKEKISNALQEVLRSPEEAVLPAFLNLKGTSAAPSVTEGEKRFIELKQEIDLLRNELRVGSRHDGKILPASEARELLERYLTAGLSMNLIKDLLTSQGVPNWWVTRQLEKRVDQAQPVFQDEVQSLDSTT